MPGRRDPCGTRSHEDVDLAPERIPVPTFGSLGLLDGGEVHYYRRPLRRSGTESEFDIRNLEQLPRVDIAYAYAGDDGTVIRALTAARAQGIVIASFPGGRLSAPKRRHAEKQGKLARRSPCPRGWLGAGDAGHQAQGDGPGRRGHPESQKGRVLLSLALTQTNQIEQLDRMFATN
jgi:L-asparaginase